MLSIKFKILEHIDVKMFIEYNRRRGKEKRHKQKKVVGSLCV